MVSFDAPFDGESDELIADFLRLPVLPEVGPISETTHRRGSAMVSFDAPFDGESDELVADFRRLPVLPEVGPISKTTHRRGSAMVSFDTRARAAPD